MADALSRWAYPADTQQNDVTIHGSAEDAKALEEGSPDDVAPVAASDTSPPTTTQGSYFLFTKDWSAEYASCPRWGSVYKRVVTDREHVGTYHWNGRRLFLGERICVPNSLCADVVRSFHERSHFGVEKTKALVERRFDLSNLNTLSHDIVSKCSVCEACKSRTGRAPGMLQNLPIPRNVFDSISIDFLELRPVPHNGRVYDYVFVVICRLTSFCVLIPTSKASLTSERCAELLLSHVFCYFGFPSQIVSDNDVRFSSLFWETVCKLCGIRHAHTTTYRPKGNGAVERTNRRIVELLRRLLLAHSSLTWLDLLPSVQFLLNETDGAAHVSPHIAVFGRQVSFLGDDFALRSARSSLSAEQWVNERCSALAFLRTELQKARDRQKEQYDKHRSSVSFAVGDQVWVNQSRTVSKLDPRWFGPCTIVATAGPNAYVVDVGSGSHKTYNVELLKSCSIGLELVKKLSYTEPLNSGSSADDSEPLAKVERIVKHRVNDNGSVQWLVKWHGSSQLTWEPVDNFVDVTEPWADYNRQHHVKVDCCA